MPPQLELRRPLILAAIMASMVMIAVEATIVSTAMPQIAGQLGDLHLYAWVFSAFLLTQTATTVVFGKLADIYGRKPVLLAGIAVFLVGSLLCGFAHSMTALIVYRLVQGIGGGAIQPISLTVVGDLYSTRERGRIQGWLASVWGISSVLGPLAGGLIINHMSWAWVFWVNIPVGILAAVGFIVYLRENVAREHQPIDVPGSALFTLGIAALMVALTELGTGSTLVIPALAVCVVAAALFIWQERRFPAPMLAIGLWTRRPIATANLATLLGGMTIIGLTTFVPMYVQGVLGQSALVAGFALTSMVLGWPIGATFATRIFPRVGLRSTLLAGGALMPFGALVFILLTPGASLFASPILAGIGSFVVGLGIGMLSTSAILIIQDTVDWSERASATASNLFSRNLGSTLGATLLGAVLNVSLARGPIPVHADQVRRLLERAPGDLADPAVQVSLGHSLHLTFWAVLAVSVGTFLLATLVPTITLRAAKI